MPTKLKAIARNVSKKSKLFKLLVLLWSEFIYVYGSAELEKYIRIILLQFKLLQVRYSFEQLMGQMMNVTFFPYYLAIRVVSSGQCLAYEDPTHQPFLQGGDGGGGDSCSNFFFFFDNYIGERAQYKDQLREVQKPQKFKNLKGQMREKNYWLKHPTKRVHQHWIRSQNNPKDRKMDTKRP